MEMVNLQALCVRPVIAGCGVQHQASCLGVVGWLLPLGVWVSAGALLDARHRELTGFPAEVFLLLGLCCFLCIMIQRKQRC